MFKGIMLGIRNAFIMLLMVSGVVMEMSSARVTDGILQSPQREESMNVRIIYIPGEKKLGSTKA